MFYKINYGYGMGLKKYLSLKGAKIAATRYMKSSCVNWLDIVEYKNGTIERHITYSLK